MLNAKNPIRKRSQYAENIYLCNVLFRGTFFGSIGLKGNEVKVFNGPAAVSSLKGLFYHLATVFYV